MTEKEFISSRAKQLMDEGIKNFPADFGEPGDAFELELPSKTLVMGEEFFGSFEILTIDGNPVHQSPSHEEAKYIIYANRPRPASVKIPKDKPALKMLLSSYEDYLDSLIKNIEKDYLEVFPDGKNANFVSSEIFRILSLARY